MLDRLRSGGLGGGVTLGGCLVVPRRDVLLVCREPEMAAEETPIAPGATVLWDGRFRIARSGAESPARATRLVVRRLGTGGWATLVVRQPDLRGHPIPPACRPSLPSLWSARGIVAVPHLDIGQASPHMSVSATFLAGTPLAGARFPGA